MPELVPTIEKATASFRKLKFFIRRNFVCVLKIFSHKNSEVSLFIYLFFLGPFPPKNVQIELLPDVAGSNKNFIRARVKWEPPDNLKNGPKNFLLKYKLKENNKFTDVQIKDSLQYDIENLSKTFLVGIRLNLGRNYFRVIFS